jgi:hypothetical protein
MEALEPHVLPSSRLANEAAGTTIRFIQASASPPLPLGHELRIGVYQRSDAWGDLTRNYTFRSMPRRSPSRAQPEPARETSGPSGRKPTKQAWTKRLSKRVVQKPDGRNLIYFEKI